MPLVYWYRDKETKEPYYYDTDDLNNEQYARVCELDMEISEQLKKTLWSKAITALQKERDDIIWKALHGSDSI